MPKPFDTVNHFDNNLIGGVKQRDQVNTRTLDVTKLISFIHLKTNLNLITTINRIILAGTFS